MRVGPPAAWSLRRGKRSKSKTSSCSCASSSRPSFRPHRSSSPSTLSAPPTCTGSWAKARPLGSFARAWRSWELARGTCCCSARAEPARSSSHKPSTRSRAALAGPSCRETPPSFPSGLIDAELFGNIANYPNSGTPERPGLIGQAQGSTLFLDEIGELPRELQAHLLRVLDADGEYQRLGEARARKADIRLIGATARTPEHLRPDFAARFRLRFDLPGLGDRREDIALITSHLLHTACKSDPRLSERLFRRAENGTLAPRVTPALMRFLVTHRYTTHVRELDALLWRAIASGSGRLDLTDAVRGAAAETRPEAPSALQETSREPPTKQEILGCLERHGGVKERAWRDLGLSSRYALKRLIRKYGIESADDAMGPESDRQT